MSSLTVLHVAKQLSLQLLGNSSLSISTICPPDEISQGCTVFLGKKELLHLTSSCANVFLISEEWIQDVPINFKKSYLVSKYPKKSFVLLLKLFTKWNQHVQHILSAKEATEKFPHAIFKKSCLISDDLSVGRGTVLEEQVFIQHNVTIGKNCFIGPGTKILHHTTIGNNCHIGPNSVIGLDGFGYELIDEKMVRIPQIGTVQIEDDVDIDSHGCIERGTLGATKIGCGTKIGSFVHIGHNCRIAKNCIIITQSGLAGSCILEEGVILAGQVGVGEHSFLGKNTKVGGKSGIVSRSKVEENSVLLGNPALPKKQFDKIRRFLSEQIATDC